MGPPVIRTPEKGPYPIDLRAGFGLMKDNGKKSEIEQDAQHPRPWGKFIGRVVLTENNLQSHAQQKDNPHTPVNPMNDGTLAFGYPEAVLINERSQKRYRTYISNPKHPVHKLVDAGQEQLFTV